MPGSQRDTVSCTKAEKGSSITPADGRRSLQRLAATLPSKVEPTLPYGMKRLAKDARAQGLRKALSQSAQRTADRPLYWIRDRVDSMHDQLICGASLEKSVLSPFGKSHGAVDSIHSPYGSLERIFGPETFEKTDVLLDVGCGKGRPLAYLAGKDFPGRLYGVELTPEVAHYAQTWASRFDNVEIIPGNVFDLNLSYVTHYFMFIPMAQRYSRALINKIENEATRRIRLYYLCDMQDGEYIDARPGWSVVRRDWIYRQHGIPLHGSPQRYSVWDFDPSKASR